MKSQNTKMGVYILSDKNPSNLITTNLKYPGGSEWMELENEFTVPQNVNTITLNYIYPQMNTRLL